jgi:peptidoglycan/xylan/chitin deacetylase (PgdA/CDA1 family)
MRAALPTFGGLYLTFDDGPDPAWTPSVLDLLAQANARATFFMVGKQARSNAELVRRVAREGHSIGNHTMTHAHPWTIGAHRAKAEVRDGAAAIEEVVGAQTKYFRPPHGAKRRAMLDEARMLGEEVVMWDRSAIDWGWLGTAERIETRLNRAQPGDIVLMHDGANKHNRPDQLLRVLPRVLMIKT